MARAKNYRKHIFCIESELDNDLKHESTSKFMLEQLQNMSGNKLKFIYRKCATKTELIHYLKKMSLKKYQDYSIIFLCLHGSTNKIYLANEELNLNEISEIVGNNILRDKIVHFGSCETIKISEHQLQKLICSTKALVVSGFTKKVEFIEGLAMEILFLDWCQYFKNTKHLENKLNSSYIGLIEQTGFKMIQRP